MPTLTEVTASANSPVGKRLIAGTVVTFGAVALFLIGRRIYLKYKESSASKALEDSIESLVVDTSETSFTSAEATLLATSLYGAMEAIGTDEDVIENIVINKVNSASDWNLLVKAFGVRPYGTYGSPLWSWMPSTDLDLMGWIRKECSNSLISQIETKLAGYGLTV